VIGFTLISFRQGLPNYGNFVLLSPLFLVLGFLLGTIFKRYELESSISPKKSDFDTELKILVVVFSVLALYHFYVTGITIFRDDVETARFDFSASGLLGIPSRAYLYGIPILALYSAIFHEKKNSRITFVIWSVFIATQIFGGFKGGLYSVFSTLIFAIILRARLSAPKLTILISTGLLASVLYVFFVGSTYQTLASGQLDFGYIAYRTTEQAAEPGYLGLAMQDFFSLQTGSAFWYDLSVLTEKYVTGTSKTLTVESIVSATLSGVRPEVGNFIVPVTVGGPVYLLLTGGPILLASSMTAIGAILTATIRNLKVSGNLMSRLGMITIINGLKVFLSNGNGAYVLINYAFTFALIFGVYIFVTRFLKNSISHSMPIGSIDK
jgi:hypothetical protein